MTTPRYTAPLAATRSPATLLVPAQQLGAGTPDGTKFLRDDGTWQTVETGAPPTPASTVASETTFGITAAVGTAADYARSDHTHGTPALGTTSTTACAGDDSRLSNARTPTSHASSHRHGGADEVATATPAANAIPKAESTGKLNSGWIPPLAMPLHASSHKAGEPDEVDITTLGGYSSNPADMLRGDGTWAPFDLQVPVLNIPFHSVASSQVTWSSMPSAETLLHNSHRHIVKADMGHYTEVRLLVNKTGTAGASGARFILRYSTTFGTTASTYTADLGTAEVSVVIDVTDSYLDSGWIALVSDVWESDVFLAIVGVNGNGSTSPQYGAVHAQFR